MTVLTYCVPDFLAAGGQIFKPGNDKKWAMLWEEFKNGTAGNAIYDLYLASTAIWASVALAPIYCFIFIGIMSAFAEIIAWCCVAITQLGLIGATVACYLYKTSTQEVFDKETNPETYKGSHMPTLNKDG